MGYKEGTYYARNREDRLKYQRKYIQDNPEKVKDSKYKCEYGITNADKQEMARQQGFKCRVCGNEFKNSRDMHIDHCHEEDQIRGILCSGCNVGLGHFKDNVASLMQAIMYLIESRLGFRKKAQAGSARIQTDAYVSKMACLV